jgi:hypothetical protein
MLSLLSQRIGFIFIIFDVFEERVHDERISEVVRNTNETKIRVRLISMVLVKAHSTLEFHF